MIPFNRTSMELKRVFIVLYLALERVPFNRTSMELKLSKSTPRHVFRWPFNRTSMELKLILLR